MLQISYWSEWDMNPVQLARFYSLCQSPLKGRSLATSFYRRMYETIQGIETDEDEKRDPTEKNYVQYFNSDVKTAANLSE